MLSPSLSNTRIKPGHSRLMTLWVIAALLAGLAFSITPARPTAAAGVTCTSQVEEGDWADPATWDCAAIPAATTNVVVATTVKITQAAAANNLTILQTADQSGVLRLDQPVTLSVAGNFDVQGTFDDHVGGTLLLNGAASQTITTNGDWVDFSNLTKIASPSGNTLLVDSGAGGLNIYGALTLQGAAGNALALHSTQPGSPWQINTYDPAQRMIDYVDVQDSNNVSDTPISVSHWVDSGGNTGWGLVTSNSTSISLEASVTTLYSGLPVTFTATLSPATDAGTVAFKDGAADIPGCASQIVAAGQTSCTTSALAVGSHSISAVYSQGGTSAPVTVEVEQFAGVMLTSSLNPSLAGSSVTFKAMVMPMSATDRVSFTDNGAPIPGCSDMALSMSGSALCTTSALTANAQGHEISVTYSGNSHFPNGNSDSLVQVVKNASSIWLNSSKWEILLGKQVTFTATVTPAEATGSVTFKDNGVDIPGCVAVPFSADAPATCTVSSLIAAAHPISAFYSGSDTYASSRSATSIEIIDRASIFMPFIRRK